MAGVESDFTGEITAEIEINMAPQPTSQYGKAALKALEDLLSARADVRHLESQLSQAKSRTIKLEQLFVGLWEMVPSDDRGVLADRAREVKAGMVSPIGGRSSDALKAIEGIFSSRAMRRWSVGEIVTELNIRGHEADAKAVATWLSKLLARGFIQRVSHGVYQLSVVWNERSPVGEDQDPRRIEEGDRVND